MNRKTRGGVLARSNVKSPVSMQFKSPLNKTNVESPKESYEDLLEQVTALKKRLQDANSELQMLEAAGYREEEIQTHIEKMHEYNEIKDVGQMVLGRIAVIEGVQSKDLYEKYGLSLQD